jgi:hypothetical protein
MVCVLNNGKGWKKTGDGPVVEIDDRFSDRKEHPLSGFLSFGNLAEPEVRLTKLGVEMIEGKETLSIRAQSEEFVAVDLYFNKQTALLVKSKKLVGAEQLGMLGEVLPEGVGGKILVSEAFLDSYKEVQGRMVPMRIRTFLDQKPVLDIAILEVRFSDNLKESEFAKPQ